MIRKIVIKQFVRMGITKNHIAFPKRYRLWGADTETVNGEPWTLQFHNGKHTDLIWVDRDTVLDKFLNFIHPLLLEGQTNLIYFHNLEFDLAVLFCKYHKLWLNNSFIKAKYKGWEIDICVGKVCFAVLNHKATKCQVKILDSRAFFVNVEKTGLGALCEQLKLPVKKLPKPDGLGDKKLKTPEFIEYAKNDAVAQFHLAEWIIKQHKEYDIRIAVSSPQFASRVFKHYYLEEKDVIKLPPNEVIDASVLSYHGGKNGYYLERPTIVNKCYEVDIVSAYPYAMVNIPNFLSGEYVTKSQYTPEYQGVWNISGRLKNCKYPVIFDHDFKAVRGEFSNIWTTSYELAEAIRLGEIELSNCFGYVWVPDGKASHNPFGDYVAHFFKRKQETPKDDSRYMLYKILLNSLYGKLIQTMDDKRVEIDLENAVALGDFQPDYIMDEKTGEFVKNPSAVKTYYAGGLFNPFIASLITGFVRAYLHKLEHKYKALHASTDSIKTTIKPVEDKNLGGITIQCFGKCYLLRNKLYLHYNEQGKLEKYALHGFQGYATQLEELIKTKKQNYKINHLFKVREAYRQNKKALAMATVDRRVDIDFSTFDII